MSQTPSSSVSVSSSPLSTNFRSGLEWFESNRQKLSDLVIKLKNRQNQESKVKLGTVLERLLILPKHELARSEGQILKIQGLIQETLTIGRAQAKASQRSLSTDTTTSTVSLSKPDKLVISSTPLMDSLNIVIELFEKYLKEGSRDTLNDCNRYLSENMKIMEKLAIGDRDDKNIILTTAFASLKKFVTLLVDCRLKWKIDDNARTCVTVLKEYLQQRYEGMPMKEEMISPYKRIRANITIPYGIQDINRYDGIASIVTSSDR